ncbi:MAG: hypothetical protein H0X35_12150, partial [Pseudonocardiales bacterium]|nr:hypothetical protein [Pseudonocardiales bacterium]
MAMTLQVEPPPGYPRRSALRRGWVVGLSAAVLVGVLAWPATSYVRALTHPGEASFAVRTVEWVRDHGGGGFVDVAENWWYSQPPTATAPNVGSLPSPAPPVAVVARQPAPIRGAPGLAPLPGEGRWAAGRPGTSGRPVLFTTFERPDPLHPSVVAGVAWVDTRATRLQLVAGTT